KALGNAVARVEHEVTVRAGRLARLRGAKLIDVFNGVCGEFSRACDIQGKRLIAGQVSWDAAFRDHGSEAPHGVSATAEPDQKDAIAFAIKTDQCGVTIDNVRGQPKPGGLADRVVNPTPGLAENEATIGGRPKARVVEGNLVFGMDAGIRTAARCAVELINVGAVLVERDAPSH